MAKSGNSPTLFLTIYQKNKRSLFRAHKNQPKHCLEQRYFTQKRFATQFTYCYVAEKVNPCRNIPPNTETFPQSVV
jgi:hypothetical protein